MKDLPRIDWSDTEAQAPECGLCLMRPSVASVLCSIASIGGTLCSSTELLEERSEACRAPLLRGDVHLAERRPARPNPVKQSESSLGALDVWLGALGVIPLHRVHAGFSA